MAYTIEQMMFWNYEEAMKMYNEFLKNVDTFRGEVILKDINNYMAKVSQYRYAEVEDYTHDTKRGKVKVHNLIQNAKKGTLILVDGESGTGKSTFAATLSKNEGFFLFDIDEYAAKLTMEHMISSGGTMVVYGYEPYIIYPNGKRVSVDTKSDELLVKKTEEIIRKGSDNGKKTTVMVGAFRNVVFRTVIARTIGKYFEQTYSIVIHDNLAANLARVKKRNAGMDEVNAINLAKSTHQEMEGLKAKIFACYGIGFNESVWVNHGAVHDF